MKREKFKKALKYSSIPRLYKAAEEGKFKNEVYSVDNSFDNKISGTSCNKCKILREISTQTNRFEYHGARLVVENTSGKRYVVYGETRQSKKTTGCVLKYSWTNYDSKMKFKDEIVGGILGWLGLGK